jgi:hypothetical protein
MKAISVMRSAETPSSRAILGDRPQRSTDRRTLYQKSQQRHQDDCHPHHRELYRADADRAEVETLREYLLSKLQRIGTPEVGGDILQDDRESER